jgi:predicted nuclease of predicted toxin-antitoxin system
VKKYIPDESATGGVDQESSNRYGKALKISADFDIVSISHLSPGSSEAAVMKMASSENRTIITFDIDYGELIFKQ